MHGACAHHRAASRRWPRRARLGRRRRRASAVTRVRDLAEPQLISSRDNPLLKDLRKLAHDSTRLPQAGPRLARGRPPVPRGAAQRGVQPRAGGVRRVGLAPPALRDWRGAGRKTVVVADALFARLERARVAGAASASSSPLPAARRRSSPARRRSSSTGCRTPATSARSCAAPRRSASRRSSRSRARRRCGRPKVLRAGMGAHFGLRLVEGAGRRRARRAGGAAARDQFARTASCCTEPRCRGPAPGCSGHEGQGVGDGPRRRAPPGACASPSRAARSR